jgi:glycosyltransferase involved in cell wall biosynthesis
MGEDLELSIVFPAYNEEANIVQSIREGLAALEGRQGELVIVDDGSTDLTASLVMECQSTDPRIVLQQHPSNKGYGAALLSGFRKARGRYVFFTDSDLQFDLKELQGFLLLIQHCDIVVGYRSPRRDPILRRLNARLWTSLVNLLFGIGVRDVNCAFKLFRREVLEQVSIHSTGACVNTEILARARSSQFEIVEVPVSHYPRCAGEQTGANPRVILRAFRELGSLYGSLHSIGP